MNTYFIEITDILFGVFDGVSLLFAVLTILAFLEAHKHQRLAQIHPYYALEHYKISDKLCLDAVIYFVVALFSGFLAILIVL